MLGRDLTSRGDPAFSALGQHRGTHNVGVQLILEILPFAAGVFASPLPVIVGIIMLFTPKPRPTSLIYVGTWMAGLTIVTVLLTLVAGFLEGTGSPPPWTVWLQIGLGALLVVAALKTWLGRAEKANPKWLSALMQAGPREAVRYGILLSAANPKELLMAVAAAIVIGAADPSTAQAGAAILVFVLVGAASVALPLLIFLLGGDRTLRRLEESREWLERNNAAVASGVLALIGVWLVLGGIGKL